MPKKTYTQVNSITLAAGTSSITFSGIPQNYRDLIIVHNNFGTSNNDANSNFVFNSDTGSNYSRIYAFYEGSSSTPVSGSGTGTSLQVFGLRTTAGVSISHIMDYSATDKHKTVLTRTNTPDHLVWMSAGKWGSTSAINSIQLNAFSGNFAIGSVISLYGIEA
jgi:hypothetical protein